MPTKFRYDLKIFDPALVTKVKAAADARGESLAGFATIAICEFLNPQTHASKKARQACPCCSKVRALTAKRRARQLQLAKKAL